MRLTNTFIKIIYGTRYDNFIYVHSVLNYLNVLLISLPFTENTSSSLINESWFSPLRFQDSLPAIDFLQSVSECFVLKGRMHLCDTIDEAVNPWDHIKHWRISFKGHCNVYKCKFRIKNVNFRIFCNLYNSNLYQFRRYKIFLIKACICIKKKAIRKDNLAKKKNRWQNQQWNY